MHVIYTYTRIFKYKKNLHMGTEFYVNSILQFNSVIDILLS